MVAELSDLHAALKNDEVIPCFQPQVELRTRRLKGFEVLARWQPAGHEPVLPFNFISLAETNGLIGAFTRQVVCKALQAAILLPEPLTLSINLSPVQMHYLSLPGQIREIAEWSARSFLYQLL
jgi:EAL domain-containing protein (putative c-di-GMP-specific phosphodiesterase class I)